jgi:tetratricopeptide (TPR) repeat protein
LLGRLYLKDNQVSAALKMALAVQKLQPKSAVGYLLEGDARMMEKAGSAAVAAYGRANSVEPSSTGIISLHRAMVLDGKGAQADLEMSKWLAKFPSDVPIRAYIAEQALLSKDFAKAIGLYEALIKLQPSNAMMLNNLAYCYQQAKDGRALATAERALKLQPDNAAVMDTLAMIQLGLGKSADALANLKRAQALAPDNAEIHFHYAQSLIAEGKLAEAKKELEQALTKSSSGDLRSAMLDTLKKLR